MTPRALIVLAVAGITLAGCGSASMRDGYWYKSGGASVAEVKKAHDNCYSFANQGKTGAATLNAGALELSISRMIDFTYCMRKREGYKYYDYSVAEEEKYNSFKEKEDRSEFYFNLSANGGDRVRK